MIAKEYVELFRYLMEKYCLLQEDIVFVENISSWCRQHGIQEPDAERPFKLISSEGVGCKMLVRENIPEEVLEERINAMSIRGQVLNVAFDRAEMLNSDHKKLAYLFLVEYASSLPEIGDEELLADDWAFKEMERLGYFRK